MPRAENEEDAGKPGPARPITLEEEFARNPELTKTDLQYLREWAEKQPHLPKMLDRELVLFLHSCYYRMEAAKATADTYFTARTHLPEFFTKRDARRPEVIQALENVGYVPLPKKTPEGHKVILCKVTEDNPARLVHCDASKAFFMVTDVWLLTEGSASGHVIVFDMDGIQFGHLARLSIVVFKKFFYYLQEALPFRLKGLHFINVVPFMDKILAMIKPFMKKEILEVLHLHTGGVDGLFKFVPQDVLPSDYGGEAPPYAQLHALTKPRMLANLAWFEAEASRVVDESKRPGKARSAGDLFGMEGSFKKLDID